MLEDNRSAASMRRLTLEDARNAVERWPRGGPMALAAIVGVVAGLGSVGFALLINGIHWLLFDVVKDQLLGGLPDARLILIPALGALLVGPITRRFAPEARGHGVPEVMLAVETAGGRIRPRVAIAKAVASALTIGSGGSVGKEGPIVQIGSAFGSTLAQRIGISADNTRLLVAAGAAGGVAAPFNAPLAGVFFALEVILRHFNARNFSVVVLSSVIATITRVALIGDSPAIILPPYRLESPLEIPLYAVLGLTCAVVAVVFIRALYWTEDRMQELPFPPLIVMPVVGGLAVGCLAMVNPGVLGLGEDAVNSVLASETPLLTVLLLLGLKLVATSVTIGSGGSGGVFRPSLFLGAMTGGVFGSIVHDLLPWATATPGAYATVGMAAVFAGAARAPITSVLILFEMTRDYGMVLPLMVAVAVATAVAQLLSPGTVYSIKLARRGVHIEDERPPDDVMQSVGVRQAMARSFHTFAPSARLHEAAAELSVDPDGIGLVIGPNGSLIGVVTQVDLNASIAAADSDPPLIELASTQVQTVFDDQTLHDALAIFSVSDIHALPVVSRARPTIPVGLLRRVDITRAYHEAFEHQDAVVRRRRLAERVQGDVQYMEVRVGATSAAQGQSLASVGLPDDVLIVAVRHHGRTLIPRGATRLESGDRVTVLATAGAADEVRSVFEGG